MTFDMKSMGIDTERFHKPSQQAQEIAQEIAQAITHIASGVVDAGISSRSAIHLVTAASAGALGTALGFGVLLADNLPKDANEWIDDEIAALIETFATNLRASRAMAEMSAMPARGSA